MEKYFICTINNNLYIKLKDYNEDNLNVTVIPYYIYKNKNKSFARINLHKKYLKELSLEQVILFLLNKQEGEYNDKQYY